MIKDGEVFVQIVDPPHPGDAKEAISSRDPEALQKPPSGVAPSPNGSSSASPQHSAAPASSSGMPAPQKPAHAALNATHKEPHE
jgi:hypothetical protein